MKRNRIIISTVLITLGLAFSSCASSSNLKVTLNKNYVNLFSGETVQLNAVVTSPTGTVGQEIEWKTTANAPFTIKDGLVTANSEIRSSGKVYAFSRYDNKAYATCEIFVAPGITPNGINLKANKPFVKDSTQKLDVNYVPSNATINKELEWKSSDNDVATVDQEGNVTVKKDAASKECTITAALKYDSKRSYSYTFTPVEVVKPTSFTISDAALTLGPGSQKTIEVTSFLPNNANSISNITWSSSDTNVATVDQNGKVLISSDPSVINKHVEISASIEGCETQKCIIKVIDTTPTDAYTVLVYMCASDLESRHDQLANKMGLATLDLKEMLAVPNQPDNVNIVIETGGCKSWTSVDNGGYGINNTDFERYHIEKNKLVKDMLITRGEKLMGDEEVLEDFITWGMKTYPADKTALIIWDHGSGMQGVCFDEFGKSASGVYENRLHNSEILKAIENSLKATGNHKLEWIGYDACLMSIQDIADFNSNVAKYMIASQETEPGQGWEYSEWISELYADANIETTKLLKIIANSYLKESSHVTYSSTSDDNAQLSILDLSKAEKYKTAWEEFANKFKDIVNSKNNWKEFSRFLDANNVLRFGASTDTQGQKIYPYDVYDVSSFCYTLLGDKSFTSIKEEIYDIINVLPEFVIYNGFNSYYNTVANLPCGLSAFVPTAGYTARYEYDGLETSYDIWREYVQNVGIFSK